MEQLDRRLGSRNLVADGMLGFPAQKLRGENGRNGRVDTPQVLSWIISIPFISKSVGVFVVTCLITSAQLRRAAYLTVDLIIYRCKKNKKKTRGSFNKRLTGRYQCCGIVTRAGTSRADSCWTGWNDETFGRTTSPALSLEWKQMKTKQWLYPGWPTNRSETERMLDE